MVADQLAVSQAVHDDQHHAFTARQKRLQVRVSQAGVGGRGRPECDRDAGDEIEDAVAAIIGQAFPSCQSGVHGRMLTQVRAKSPGPRIRGRRLFMPAEDLFEPLRRQMVAEIAAETGLLATQLGRASLAERVIEVMGRVPRHTFVPADVQPFAYLNSPLPIGHGKTISQPFIVALMTDLLDVQPDSVVLEIGTGFGYQAAILAELARQVYSMEIIEAIAAQGKKRLTGLGYKNVTLRVGNGALGWAEHAPYDRIMVTAAPDLIP